jgi:hypothetical protein
MAEIRLECCHWRQRVLSCFFNTRVLKALGFHSAFKVSPTPSFFGARKAKMLQELARTLALQALYDSILMDSLTSELESMISEEPRNCKLSV